MILSLPARIRQESIKKLVEVATLMESNKINLIEGSRHINRLRHYTEDANDDLFTIFILVNSDTDDIPLNETRKNFSKALLEEKDKKMVDYLANMKPTILQGCKEIIKKFS